MERRRLALIAMMLLAPITMAAQVTIEVPDDATLQAKLAELCEDIRARNGVRASTWGNKGCAEWIVHTKLHSLARQIEIRNVQDTAQQAGATAAGQFLDLFPFWDPVSGRMNPPVRMFCGDGITDNEPPYVEGCDDSGESATCTNRCTVSACGDGILNATAGETCDDGNTTPGDGCNDTCQTE